MLVGATRKIKPIMATYNRVAALNTFMMMTAEAQVYSHAPDFYWLDENGKSQTDWRLFSKEKLMDSEATGIQIAAYAEPWSLGPTRTNEILSSPKVGRTGNRRTLEKRTRI